MKNKKNEEKRRSISVKENQGNGQRVWKIMAIAVIVVFAGFIVGGIIKAQHIRSSFVKPTQSQIDYATKIATEKLQSMGGNISAFQVEDGGRMRRMHDGVSKNIIQVSFYNDTTTHTYLVDVDTGEVLLHSQTDIYKEIGGPKPGCSKDDNRCNGGFRSPPSNRDFFGKR